MMIAITNPKIAQFSKEIIEQSQRIAEQPTTTTEPGFAASGRVRTMSYRRDSQVEF